MANYFIIGGDGKQYGPVTADDVRKWVAEGRLNEQSQAKGEGDAEWRPLSAFPELGDAFAPPMPQPSAPPPFSLAGDAGREAALQKVKAPAVALMVTGILDLILAIYSLVGKLFFPPNLNELLSTFQQFNNPQLQEMMQRMFHILYGPLGVASDLFGLVLSLLILIGAIRMHSLRSYEFSMTAAIVAMLPCVTSCCLIGLPFGIWALMVLAKPEVKSHFN